MLDQVAPRSSATSRCQFSRGACDGIVLSISMYLQTEVVHAHPSCFIASMRHSSALF